MFLSKYSYELQVESLRNQSFNMEQANYAAETMKDTHATVSAMKDGVKQMQKEFKKINIDEIEVIKYYYFSIFFNNFIVTLCMCMLLTILGYSR